jgi:type VI secretion system secreted protein VgrG
MAPTALTQANRFIAINTPLGEDALIIRSFSFTEHISRLFQVEVDLISLDGEVEFEQLIGDGAIIRLELGKDQTRYFHGIISRFVQTKNQGNFAHYRATIVPWLWLLTRTSDCRIFQNKSIPEIIEEVFKAHGLDSYELRLSGTYGPWDFCVQYRETDFNFVSRLMEQEGIYYYFEHAEDKHTLVIADSPSAHAAYEGYETVIYRPPTENQPPDRECITDWVVEKELKPGAYAINDFNFETPKTHLLAKSSIERSHPAAAFEVYDYPGEYELHEDGEFYAKVRIQELQSTYETLHAQATARGMCAGYLFTLQDHPRDDQNREYLITGSSCQVDAGDFESGASTEGDEFFSCSFTCIDCQTPFRPARNTPKPIIQGPQTAIVVGPKGDEIHTDDQARVKVQFHWDRYGKRDENSSCWVRVSQPWAGKGWGSMATPRIGQEVIVEFLEGDPDRPIITGRVYNGDNAPPYAGGQGVVSGLKSNTHKGTGYNEMSMDDTKGKEKITIHAQYDMNTTVENDQTNTVKGKFTEEIEKDTAITIKTGKLDHKVNTGTADYYVKAAVTEKFDDTWSSTTKNNITIKSTAGEILVEAANKITLHTGDSKITMEKSGNITVSGKKIAIIGEKEVRVSGDKIDIGGGNEAKLGVGSQNIVCNVAKTALAGAAINSSAVGMHEISGAVVKIN